MDTRLFKRKFFTSQSSNNLMGTKMRVTNFRAVILIAIVALAGVVSFNLAESLLSRNLTIPTSGSIPTITLPSGVYQSETRALFVHALSLIDPDWTLIAKTARDYCINKLVVEAAGNDFVRWDSTVQPNNAEWVLPDSVNAAHANGLELHISMNVIAENVPQGHPDWESKRSNGAGAGGVDPSNPHARAYLVSLVQEVITKYPDIDGFMFDYIRYNWDDEPFTESARQSLAAYLNEPIPDLATMISQFNPNEGSRGPRYKEFMEWRSKPIDDLVRDMRNAMRAIKPTLQISAAVWEYLVEQTPYPAYWRYWLGQDWLNWIRLGYLDWFSPMVYTDDLTYVTNYMKNIAPLIGGPHGIIPHVVFIDNCVDAVSPPSNWANRVDIIRQNGGDGWITWRYGGPGDGQGSDAPDIRNYLNAISRPKVFSIRNIVAFRGTTSATITWTTDLPATSKVEYSTSPLFTSRFAYDSAVDFNYWDIDYAPGTIIGDTTPLTNHSITLTGLNSGARYYYRVQSQDVSGIATSSVFSLQL